ncbi:MAG: hypothetical protein J5849_01370, partial [Clostridia bacterium]|nr:hypothetical protein [Clostridia bacterium]
SRRWVEAMCRPAMRPEEKSGEFDYGLRFWVGRESGARLLNGMFGQNALTYPDTGYSIVAHASNADLFQQGPFFRICDEYFSKNAKSREEAGEKTDLSDAIRVFRNGDEKPDAPAPQKEKRSFFDFFRRKKAEKTSLLPAEAEAFSGRAFVPSEVDCSLGVMPRVMQAVENEYTAGITRIAFEREEDRFTAVFTEGEAAYSLPVGIGRWQTVRRVFGETEWLLGIRGRFASDEDGRPALILTVRFLETPFSRTFRFYLDRNEMEIRADEKPGKAFLIRFAETMGGEFLEKPLVGSALSKIDPDLLGYKLDALFSPHKIFREDLTRKEKNV